MKITQKRIIFVVVTSFILLFLLFSYTEQNWNKYALLGITLLILGLATFILKMFLGKLLSPLFDKHYILIGIIMFIGLFSLSLYLLWSDSGGTIYMYALEKSLGIVSALLCLVVLWKLIKGFRIPEGKASINDSFEKELTASKNLGDLLKDGLWEKFLADERSKKYFDVTGRIIADAELSKAIIAATIMDVLNRYGFFKETYNTVRRQAKVYQYKFTV